MSKCLLCNSKKKDPRCGEFIQKGKVAVHEYCLYLSSALLTNGDDDNGLYGFLEKDIYAESKRTSKLDCAYCHQPYANIGCCKTKCQRSFHTLCGIENGCENQFTGTFRSYCDRHVHKYLRKVPPIDEICCICYDRIRGPKKDSSKNHLYVNYIEAPCCKNGWFHRDCLQGFARSAGYFFKCPLCNDTKKFKGEIPYRGIFVPDRDAAWEIEPNAYAELLERPSKCEAEICQHKKGRNSSKNDNPLVYCKTCGSVAMHEKCLPPKRTDFICKDCVQVTERARNSEDSGHESLPLSNQHENENEEIDVCNISDTDDDETDFLEKILVKRNRRPIISESSDEKQFTIPDCKAVVTLDKSKDESPCCAGKRFDYDSSEDSDDSDIFFPKNDKKSTDSIDAKNHKVSSYTSHESDASSDCVKFRSQKKSYLVINSTDESSDESVKLKRKRNVNMVIASTDEDNTDSSSMPESRNLKRRRTVHNKEISKQNLNKKSTQISETARKPLNDLNGIAPNTSYSSFSANLNLNDEGDSMNISCIANRTRHRKSINNSKSSNKFLMSEYEESESSQSSAKTSKMRYLSSSSSSSSSSQCSSLGYSTTSSSAASSCSTNSSTPVAYSSTNQLRRQKINAKLQTNSSSLSSLSSDASSVATTSAVDLSSDNNSLNISCVANRTRRRKSVYYSDRLEFINEENDF